MPVRTNQRYQGDLKKGAKQQNKIFKSYCLVEI